MLHFVNTALSGHTSVWGTTRITDTQNDWQNKIYEANALHALPMVGQHLGGIGIYRTETGQPIEALFDGAYTFDTYLTTYSYANGAYSLALEVHVSLSETLNLADVATYAMIYQVALTDGVSLDGVALAPLVASVALSENLSLTDAISVGAVYGILLPESLLLGDAVSINDVLIAYVVNANTGAVSTYTNYNFNSFAKLNGRYFGATDAGIYELTGADDDGTAIDASVVLPTTDFQVDKVADADSLKRLPTVYLGVNTIGDMMLKVTANGDDNFYTLSGTTTTSLHTGRMLLGKGVAARYWDFELTNVDGADFTLESMTFYPVALTRRIVRG